MLNAILLVIQIGTLFFLSRRVYKILSSVFLKLFRSEKVTYYFLSILYLPGTFLHEISHFLMAIFLLVPVGRIDLIPKIEDDRIMLGTTEVAKTDPFRRFLIGVAPIFFGTIILISIIYFATNTEFFNTTLKNVLIFYLTFTISNTMFLSKKDLEGAWLILLIFMVLVILAQLMGISFDINFNSGGVFAQTLKDSNWYLMVPIMINLIIFVLFNFLK